MPRLSTFRSASEPCHLHIVNLLKSVLQLQQNDLSNLQLLRKAAQLLLPVATLLPDQRPQLQDQYPEQSLLQNLNHGTETLLQAFSPPAHNTTKMISKPSSSPTKKTKITMISPLHLLEKPLLHPPPQPTTLHQPNAKKQYHLHAYLPSHLSPQPLNQLLYLNNPPTQPQQSAPRKTISHCFPRRS